MTDETMMGRRELLAKVAGLGAATVGLVVLGGSTGCGGDEGPNCNDTSGLTPQQQSTRSALGYVDPSPHGAQKNCANCNFFTAAGADACGSCTLIAGPIAPEAFCNSWAAKG